jgi:hypothetical protein
MADIIDFRVKNGLLVTTTATIEGATSATSTNTGALQVHGGAGIGGNVYVGGIFSATGAIYGDATLTLTGDARFLSLTTSTSATTGALVVDGGVGIGESLYVAGDTRILSTTPSTSATTGALTIAGGLGIAGDVWVGGTLYGSILGGITTASNIAFGTAGQTPYQTAPGTTAFYGPGTAGQILKSRGTLGPQYVNTETVYVGYAVTASNINAGTTGDIVYQGNPGSTGFVSIGNPGEILIVNANSTAPVWSNTTSVYVGRATTATYSNNASITNDTVSATKHYIAYTNTSTGYGALKTSAVSGLTYYPSSGNVGIGVTTAASKLDVGGAVRITGVTTVTNVTQANSTQSGALQVANGGLGVGGNVYIGNTLTVLSTAFSTSTLGGNAAYIAGGLAIGRSLYVKGQVLFEENVTFAGTTTNVFSTNTVYTDNFIDLHFPQGAGPGGGWTFDDGFDIGHIYHHYDDDRGDEHGALIWHNESDELRWYMDNVEYVGGSKVYNFDTGTFGTFRTGAIHLVSTTTSISTATGALTVAGGAGIGGDLHVGGTIYGTAEISGSISTATNLANGYPGQLPFQVSDGITDFYGPGSTGTILVGQGPTAPTFVTTSSLYVGYAATATNISDGTKGQLVIQTNTGTTGFAGPGTLGQILVSQGAVSGGPVFTNTASIYVGNAEYSTQSEITDDPTNVDAQFLTFVSTSSGYTNIKTDATALVFVPSSGNLGIGTITPYAKLDVAGGVFISGLTTVTNTTNASSTLTGAFQVKGGAGIGLNLYVGGSANIAGNGTITGDLAVNGGDITSSAATFNLLNTGVTTLNLGGASTRTTISAATGYTAIRNLTTITNTTDALTTTSGALTVLGGLAVAKDIRVGGTMYGLFSGSVTGTATSATNLTNGTAGQVPYQTAPGATSFFGPGTAGQFLKSNGTSAPSYVDTSTMYVGYAATATNLNAGLAGSIPYQSAVGATTFLSIGTATFVLASTGTEPTWTSTAGLVAGSADTVKVTNDVASTTTHYLTFVNTSTGYSGIKTAAATGITYVPSTGNLGIGTTTPGYNLDINSSTNAIIRAYGTTIGRLSLQNSSRHYSISAQGTNLLVYDETGSTTRLTLDNAGNFGIGLTPSFKLDVGGATRISGVTTVTNTTAATNTTTGALQVYGGVGVGGSMYVKNRVGYVNTSNVSRVYQYYNAATDSLDTVFE